MPPVQKNSQEETNASGIRAKMCDIISAEYKKLIKEQVNPWIFYNSKGVHVKEFDGKEITIYGLEYSDSKADVFWHRHIEP